MSEPAMEPWTPWVVLAALAAGTYALKAAGPMLLGGRVLPTRLRLLAGLLPPALLAALVVTSTVADGSRLVVDARLAGVAAAGVALWRGWSFLPAVLVACAATALVRLVA